MRDALTLFVRGDDDVAFVPLAMPIVGFFVSSMGMGLIFHGLIEACSRTG
jgi:hypothetical protein